jgi:hypothetical protein
LKATSRVCPSLLDGLEELDGVEGVDGLDGLSKMVSVGDDVWSANSTSGASGGFGFSFGSSRGSIVRLVSLSRTRVSRDSIWNFFEPVFAICFLWDDFFAPRL